MRSFYLYGFDAGQPQHFGHSGRRFLHRDAALQRLHLFCPAQDEPHSAGIHEIHAAEVQHQLSGHAADDLAVYLLAQKKREGMELEALRDYAEDLKLHICHWFTVEGLQFLRRGGRVSAAAAVIGSILSIKPVLHVDNEGRLIPVAKVRGRKASLRAIAEKVQETMLDRPDQTLFISHGDSEEDARLVAEMIKERTGLELQVLNFVGPVIGSHSGPGTIAVFFIGSER